MARFPSRFRRLDDILADLPVEDPMLLTELDGYLTGIAVCPDAPTLGEWLPPIWGGLYGESAPFEDPIDVRLFADMVLARYAEILRDLGRGKLQPIFDVDDRNGDALWEMWIEGFRLAVSLRADAWRAICDGTSGAAAAASAIQTLIDIAGNETSLTSMEVNRVCDTAAEAIPRHVLQLHAARDTGAVAPPAAERAAKVGRNDPCPCGSGRKHKKCCGAA